MKNKRLAPWTALTIVLTSSLLSGCESLENLFPHTVSRTHRSTSRHSFTAPPRVTKELADTPPPAPRIDNITPSPGPGYVWMDGYWNWRGGKYIWENGRWTTARPGQFWVSPHWENEGAGWRLHPGYWKKMGKG